MGHRLGVHRTYFNGVRGGRGGGAGARRPGPPASPVDQLQAAPLLECDGSRRGRRLGPGPVAPARPVARPRLGRVPPRARGRRQRRGLDRHADPVGADRARGRTQRRLLGHPQRLEPALRRAPVPPGLVVARHDDRPGRLRRLQQVRRGQERPQDHHAHAVRAALLRPVRALRADAPRRLGAGRDGSDRPLGRGGPLVHPAPLRLGERARRRRDVLLQQHHQQHRALAPGGRQGRRLRGHAARDPHAVRRGRSAVEALLGGLEAVGRSATRPRRRRCRPGTAAPCARSRCSWRARSPRGPASPEVGRPRRGPGRSRRCRARSASTAARCGRCRRRRAWCAACRSRGRARRGSR